MAKRFYNLERETKEALKEADRLGISSKVSDITILNNTVLKNKTVGAIYTPEDVLMLRGNPYFYTNFSNQYCFKPIVSTGVRNLANYNLNGAVGSPYRSFSDKYRGGVKLANGFGGNIPFNHYGDNTSFTLCCWVEKNNEQGVYTTFFFCQDVYKSAGFRAGFKIPNIYKIWSTESGGNLSLETPANSIPDNTPKYICITYEYGPGTCIIYLNGVQSNSITGKIVKPLSTPNTALAWNGSLNATSVTSTTYQMSVYHRALSAAEILDNYNITKWRFGL